MELESSVPLIPSTAEGLHFNKASSQREIVKDFNHLSPEIQETKSILLFNKKLERML